MAPHQWPRLQQLHQLPHLPLQLLLLPRLAPQRHKSALPPRQLLLRPMPLFRVTGANVEAKATQALRPAALHTLASHRTHITANAFEADNRLLRADVWVSPVERPHFERKA